MHVVTTSFNTTVGQMTGKSQWPKGLREKNRPKLTSDLLQVILARRWWGGAMISKPLTLSK